MSMVLPYLGSIVVHRDMLVNVSFWVAFQVFFHCMVALILKPNWPRFAAKNKHIRWSMYNRSVAAMHSCVITGMSVYYWLYVNPDWTVFQEELHPFAQKSLDYMIAYLIYDSVHESTFPERADKETLLHHGLGLITHVSARLTNAVGQSNYYMMIYLAELSTPFLHLCWAMYAMGFKDLVLFKVVCFIVLGSYLVVRVIWGPFMLWHCYTNAHNFTSPQDKLLYMPNLIVLAIFCILNWVWFRALLVKFVSVPPKGKEVDESKDDQLASGSSISGGGAANKVSNKNGKKID